MFPLIEVGYKEQKEWLKKLSPITNEKRNYFLFLCLIPWKRFYGLVHFLPSNLFTVPETWEALKNTDRIFLV